MGPPREDRVLDGPASGEKGSKGRNASGREVTAVRGGLGWLLIYQVNGSNAKAMAPTCAESSDPAREERSRRGEEREVTDHNLNGSEEVARRE